MVRDAMILSATVAPLVPSHGIGLMWARVLWTPCPCQRQICTTALDGPHAKSATVAHLVPSHRLGQASVRILWTPCPFLIQDVKRSFSTRVYKMDLDGMPAKQRTSIRIYSGEWALSAVLGAL